jgi:hypothetical protein
MAEVLLSPGVVATETDSSFLTAQPIQAGAAILGPTAKGPVGIPTLVTTYSDFVGKFGSKVESGSAEYTYFTSISAYNYFQQGGDSLLVTRIVSASAEWNPATSSTITNSDAVNSFTLETLSEGTTQNSSGSTGTSGELANGTVDNIRWEVVSPDTASGNFSLLIRRGDDITNSKTILETWANVSLDPNTVNYIEKVIGNSTQTVTQDLGTGEWYIANSGTYNTLSRLVRVKSVSTPTLNYFDNAGNAKSEFTGSIPLAASGTLGGATGENFNASNSPAQFYENISNANTQGLVGESYDNSIALLLNRDLFKYNLVTAPGLTAQTDSTQINSLINNAQTRGDNLAVVDLRLYDSEILQVTSQASTYDSSYGAAYWPWLQTIDPDLGSQVWIPSSAMIPGVYAFNDRSGEAWFAPAGLSRGGLSTVIRAERNLTNGNRDTLYQSNVNPIATFPNTGVVVFGQKTLQKKASALDRINVRRLLIALKNYISQIADNLVFEQNTTATRNNFLSQVNPYLESVQQRQGLYAFKVVMDESNNTPDVIDRNQLIGQIYLQPTKTAEFIYLDFNILPTGATFPA